VKSIQVRLGILFVLFFLLLTVSVGVTLWSLQSQAEDALMVNLAGRQRMLVQQMTRMALEIQNNTEISSALVETSQFFEETLHAFQSGGRVFYPADKAVLVLPIQDREIQQQLRQVEWSWDIYHTELENYLALINQPGAELEASLVLLSRYSSELVAEADEMVRLLQDASEERVRRLLVLQGGFFIAALILLAAGSQYVRVNILMPLELLGQAARRIGRGDLSTPVQTGGSTEVGLLTETLENMRGELDQSHRELSVWAQTLEEKVEGRTRELDALYTVSQEISARLDLREVLNSITSKAAELLHTEVAFLCLLDPELNTLNLQSIRGPDETVRKLSAPADNPYIKTVLKPPCGDEYNSEVCSGTCGIMNHRFLTSHLAAPLIVENKVIGALCVGDKRKGILSQDAQPLLIRLASAAAVAIENARLYEQAERLATLEERQRIAGEMHDGLAQMLYALGFQLDRAVELMETGSMESALEIVERARLSLEDASTEVRQAIANLQEEPVNPKTIQDQLRELIQQQAQEGAREIDWQVNLGSSFILSPMDARQLIGIVQEALVNARRHSAANQIRVELCESNGEASLLIADDGRGFDLEDSGVDDRRHFGLKIMAARAAQLGGQIVMDSAPGKGTRISVVWPLRQPDLSLFAVSEEAE
jgi:two-component system, NarL family, nitrate/nitrite sensor histidine kinase NarX